MRRSLSNLYFYVLFLLEIYTNLLTYLFHSILLQVLYLCQNNNILNVSPGLPLNF